MRVLAAVLFSLLSLAAPAQELPRRGSLNLPLRALNAEEQTKFKLAAQEGLIVTSAPPANAPELRQGDVIVAVGGKPFTTIAAYNELVRPTLTGAETRATVLRDGKRVDVTIKVVPKPLDKGENYSVVYSHVVSKGKRIRTMVSRPIGFEGKRPVMFWIQGINASSVDSSLSGEHYISKMLKPFVDAGWATVRVEKEGAGDSEGGPAHLVDFLSEVDIYRQALLSLKKYDFIDLDKIVVFGHSMGGCHAPIVASEFPVKAIITYGTVSDSWLEWQIKAQRIQGPLTGQTESQVDTEVRRIVAVYHYLYNEKKSVQWILDNHPHLASTVRDASPDGVMMNPRSIQYMVQLNDHNFASYWEKVGNAKVLALFGENDFIAIEGDQSQVAAIVNRVKPGNGTYLKLPGIDHGFKTTTSMADSVAKFGGAPSVFEPSIIPAMKKWLTSIGF